MRYLLAIFLVSCTVSFGQQKRSTTLLVNVAPQCGLSIVNSSVRFDTANDLATGEIQFSYRVRTSQGGGQGSVKLRTDDPGRSMTYSSTVAGAGVAPPGTRTVASGESAVVATFGADAHSSRTGDTGTISWSMAGAYAPRWSLTIECQ